MHLHPFVASLVFGVPLMGTTFEAKARAVRAAMERAQMRAGLSDKECAACCELDQSQWTKQRSLGGIVGRLVALPVEFWEEFIPQLAQIVGVRTDTADDRLERVVRRALKAELQKDTSTVCDDSSNSSAA